MKQRLLLVIVLMLALVSSAAAQYIVIGPPDDPTYIDTTGQSNPYVGKPTPSLNTSLGAQTVLPIDTINISQLDCSQFPYICAYVEALDSLGRPIGGLPKDSFCLFQDGVPIPFPNFTIQELTIGSCITSICLVVDVSGSMADNNKMNDAKAAMRRFVRNMDAYDRVAIVSFANSVVTVQAFTSDTTLLLSKINGLVASGNTACFDGVWQGVNVTLAELGSKAVIAFTDGLENRSHITPQPPNGVGSPATGPYTDDSTLICNFANGAGIPIYTFNLGPIDNTYYNPEAMQAFATGTSGFWGHAPSGNAIDSLYDIIKLRLCSRYKICYTSLDTIQNGQLHVTQVCHKVGGNCVNCDSLSCREQSPPNIVRTPPTEDLSDTCQVRTAAIPICVKVTDLDTPLSSMTVRLFYRLAGSPSYPSYVDVPMTQQGGPLDSIFCYTIPSTLLNCRSALEYYITVSDGQHTLSNPATNPQTNPYVVSICPNLPPIALCANDTSMLVCNLSSICRIGFTATDPDNNLATKIVTPGTLSGNQVCFTPVAGVNQIRFIATDSCGLADTCFSTVTVTLNAAPVADAGRDSTLALCAAVPICITASCSDPNNNLSTCQLVSGPGTYNGSAICFTPASTGTYTLVLKATDACGLIDYDTSVVTVTLNLAPVADAGRDSTLSQCVAAPICITAACSDPNGNLSTCQLVSGPGTYNGSQICFTPAASGTYTLVLKATDACGLIDYDTSVVNVTLNQAPVANAGRDSTLFQCTPAPICITAACTDPNANLTTCQLVSGPGTYNGSQICFTPAASGTYTLVLKATDACGLTDYDTSVVIVSLNQAPLADAGRDSTLAQCSAAPICITAACSDPNGNLTTCQLVSGPGTYNGSQICFTPASSGTYTLVLKATDACGLIDYDTSVVTVTLNLAPVADAGRDSTLSQCVAAPICITAACSDPNGNLSTCQLVSGPGTYNGSQICFTPAASGTYTLVLKATDACGLIDYDTSVVNVTLNQAPVANAGRDSTLFQCTPAPICITAACTDPNANLTTCQLVSGPGTYNGSQICFTPAASGTYTLVLKATDACGLTDYDTSVVIVSLNQAPLADAGRDSTLAQCSAAPICITAACSDPNGNLTTCQLVSGPGTYNGSQICFTPASSGTYTLVLKATDACGLIDYDTSVVTVTLNLAPVADAGRDSTLSQCVAAPICITAACSDPNGNLSTCQLVSGPGTYNGSQICFTPAASGTYTLVLKATDACGLIDYDTSVVNVTLNQAPVANAGRDSTLFQCVLAPICITASCSDPNGNLSTCQLTSGPGTYNGSQICFTPAAPGTYTFILKATDACGATDFDTSVVNVSLNQAPVANAGRDSTLFQCAPGQVCIPAGCTDADNNLSSCLLISGPGTLNGGGICFTPAGAGIYTFIVRATDACGAIDLDTSVVTVSANSAPSVTCHGDTTMFLCSPTQVCLNGFVVTDPDNNVSNVAVTGGTLNGNQVCFTPVAGVNTIRLIATDACGKADTCQTIVTVTYDSPPDAVCPSNANVFVCSIQPICVQGFSASDVDGNLSTVVASPGTLNGNQVCFTPVAGVNTIRLIATDVCGKADTCFTTVNVTVNSAPVVSCAHDTTIFVCSLAQICLNGYTASDPDGNLDQVTVTGGTLNGSQVCFTPVVGVNTITLTATDECGASTQCVTHVTVALNSPPVVTCPGNQTMFVCNLNQLCLNGYAATDPDNNIVSTQVTGGIVQGNQLCFTPAVGSNAIRVIVTDACGVADTCQTTISITLNTPPVANAGPDQSLNCRNSGDQICWNASCSDVNPGSPQCELVSPIGTYNGSQICFAPTSSGSYTFVLKATDGCGAVDFDTAVVQVRLNVAPVVDVLDADTSVACLDAPLVQLCVPFTYSDADQNVKTITASGIPGATLAYAGGNGTVCFTPPQLTAVYNFSVTIEDSCGRTATAQHQHLVALVDCDTATCFSAQIEKTHNTFQGSYENVSVSVQSDALQFGGFDFLIAYDNSGLSFVDAKPGQIITTCGWEYFTYRHGATGNCGGPCPSGLIRIVALADANNGANHPSCYGASDDNQHEVFILRFLVTNDRIFECQYLPVRFYWFDCGDNSISTVTGDTLYLDKRIYAFDGQLRWDEFNDVLFPDAARPLGLGARDECLLGDKYHPIRCIEFIEGGVDVICADSIDAPGDLNLNGLANEIADAVLYTNYFLYGSAALDTDPIRRQAQIAASDVNQDGTVLSVGDLVYLLRIVVGDALPFPKLSPFASVADFKWQDGELSVSSSAEIGALMAKFSVTGSHSVTNLSAMDVISRTEDGEVSVLLYSGMADMKRKLSAGTNQLLRLDGDADLISVEAADYEGNLLSVRLNKPSLPKEFALRQNRPNPFNPTTQIELDLPIASEWKIEIFNITGQLVKTLAGNGVGRIVAEWDGSGAPSGVYFYRASAGSFMETRKMLLLK